MKQRDATPPSKDSKPTSSPAEKLARKIDRDPRIKAALLKAMQDAKKGAK